MLIKKWLLVIVKCYYVYLKLLSILKSDEKKVLIKYVFLLNAQNTQKFPSNILVLKQRIYHIYHIRNVRQSPANT